MSRDAIPASINMRVIFTGLIGSAIIDGDDLLLKQPNKPVETTQKPVKGALGNRRSKCTDQRLAMIRSVQVELMR